MTFDIKRTWFGRWKVYETGPGREGQWAWIATFRIEGDARRFISRWEDTNNA